LYEIEVGILAITVMIVLIYVVKSWKDVKSAQFNMEAQRSRRMSQVRAARGQVAPQPTPSAGGNEAPPQWVYSLLERMGIDEIPEEEPAGLVEALDKYEPLIRPFIKGFMDGQGQPQQQQQEGQAPINPAGFL